MPNTQNLLLRCMVWLVAIAASSAGTVVAQTPEEPCTIYARTATLDMPATISAGPDAVAGTILTPWATAASQSPDFNCYHPYADASGIMLDLGPGLQNSGLTVKSPYTSAPIVVWQTSVPGIGVAMVAHFILNGCRAQPWFGVAATGNRGACNGTNTQHQNSTVLRVALVKTGPITSGVLSGALLLSAKAVFRATATSPYVVTKSPLRISYVLGPVRVVGSTCTVTTPSQSVNLSPAAGFPIAIFTGVSATSTPVPFSLRLNCGEATTRVGVTFTDARNPGNVGNVLPLSANSSAGGLGVQILNKGQPVNFGPDAATLGNTNQIMLTVSGNQNVDLPFSARYIQTNARVTPGTANALASFTFAYQ